MKLEQSVACSDRANVVIERVTSILLSRGYVRKESTFIRGSWWGTLASLNPKNWAVRVTIESGPDMNHLLRFDVNTTGHPMITDAERRFWDEELQAAVRALRGETISQNDLATAESAAAANGLLALKSVVLYAAALGVVFGVAQYLLSLPWIR